MVERKLGIIGATGFIGGKLATLAVSQGWSVVGFSRSGTGKSTSIREWRTWGDHPDLSGLDAVVNLAGYPVDRRWTDKNRRLFYESRIGATRTLVESLRVLPPERRPSVLVNGSAVGIYGDRGEEILEDQTTPGSGYLVDLCREWEVAALTAEDMGLRVAMLRIGIVLGSGGAAFDKMRTLFQFGLGGRLGNGEQWMPWIHVHDLVAAILHIIDHPKLSGPVNGSAPSPVKNAELTRELARALHRPAIFHAPVFALKLLLGEFGGMLVQSQRAIPKALLESGFRFTFPELPMALADLTQEG